MKIALVGYGKMGHEIERIALQRGHQVVCTVDVDTQDRFGSEAFRSADVAIEFTGPTTAFDNYLKCFAAGLPVVSGSTGWLERMPEIERLCRQDGRTFFYASNFSLGVNLFFALNKFLAEKMNAFPQYDVRMKEVHHIHKLDAPSGTAKSLAEDVLARLDRKTEWVTSAPAQLEGKGVAHPLAPGANPAENQLEITAERVGEVPGYHEVTWKSDVDTITIAHDAKSRAGFALGAVLAAEYVQHHSGFLGMQDMLGF